MHAGLPTKGEIELEERTCKCGCLNRFRVSPDSAEEYAARSHDPSFEGYHTMTPTGKHPGASGYAPEHPQETSGLVCIPQLMIRYKVVQWTIRHYLKKLGIGPCGNDGRMLLYPREATIRKIDDMLNAREDEQERKNKRDQEMNQRRLENLDGVQSSCDRVLNTSFGDRFVNQDPDQDPGQEITMKPVDTLDPPDQTKGDDMAKDESKLLNATDMAKELGIGYSTFCKYAANGTFTPENTEFRQRWAPEKVKAQALEAADAEEATVGDDKPGKKRKAKKAGKKKKALGRGVDGKLPDPPDPGAKVIAIRQDIRNMDADAAIKAVERGARKAMLGTMVKLAEQKHADGDDLGAYTILHHVARRQGLVN